MEQFDRVLDMRNPDDVALLAQMRAEQPAHKPLDKEGYRAMLAQQYELKKELILREAAERAAARGN